MSDARPIPVAVATALWAALSLALAFYGNRPGVGGLPFALTLVVFVLLLAGQILIAAGELRERFASWLSRRGYFAAALSLWPVLAYLIYAAGTNSFAWKRVGLCVAYALAPSLVLLGVRSQTVAHWRDYLAVLLVWLPVEFRWMHGLWPYPEGRWAYVLTALFAVNVAIAAFLLFRRLEGVGYTLAWGRKWGWLIAGHFVVLAAILIPLGLAIGFIRFDLSYERLKTLPQTALVIFLFTAWPEEFLFRGLLQNLLSRTLKSEMAGWMVGSVVFGLSHINNLGFPNWRYVLLATLAGLVYGRAWSKTGSIFASSVVHMLVDLSWHLLFRTL